jgi:hypothetical protein
MKLVRTSPVDLGYSVSTVIIFAESESEVRLGYGKQQVTSETRVMHLQRLIPRKASMIFRRPNLRIQWTKNYLPVV